MEKTQKGLVTKILKIGTKINLGFYQKNTERVLVHKSLLTQVKSELKNQVEQITKVESEKVPNSTQTKEPKKSTKKVEQQTQTSLDDVRRIYGNKIFFLENKSGNFNAEKGVIDEVIEKIEKMKPLPKCVKVETMPYGERKGKKTLFVNINAKYNGKPKNKEDTKKLLEKLGYEAVSLD